MDLYANKITFDMKSTLIYKSHDTFISVLCDSWSKKKLNVRIFINPSVGNFKGSRRGRNRLTEAAQKQEFTQIPWKIWEKKKRTCEVELNNTIKNTHTHAQRIYLVLAQFIFFQIMGLRDGSKASRLHLAFKKYKT